MIPQREKIHHFEPLLQSSLKDNDLYLVFNYRLGYWVVAIWDEKERHPANGHLNGIKEGVHYDSMTTNWNWVLSCIRPLSGENARAFEPVEPGYWIIKQLGPLSIRTRDDVPGYVANGSVSRWMEWIEDRNDEIERKRKEHDEREFLEEVDEAAEILEIKQKVSINGDIASELRSNSR